MPNCNCKVINFCRCHHPDQYKHLDKMDFDTDDEKKLKKQFARDEALFIFDNHAIKAQVERLVNNADQAFEEDLQDKQKRLEGLLSTEDTMYEGQYMDFIKGKIDREIQARIDTNIANQARQEREKQEMKKQKMLKAQMLNCDEIRIPLRQKLLEDSKRCQLEQIKDKEKQALMERDRNRMWSEIGCRRHKMMLEQEQLKSATAYKLNMCTAGYLKEQIAINEIQKAQEIRDIEAEKLKNMKMLEEALKKDQEEADARKNRSMKLARELKEQLKQQEEKKRILALQAGQINKIFAEATQREIDMEKAKKSSFAAIFKKETFMYLDYLKQIEEEKLQQQKEIDKVLEKDRIEYNNQILAKCQEARIKTKNSAMDNFRGQKEQMLYAEELRHKVEAHKLQEEVEANEMYRRNRELDDDAKRRRKIAAYQYGCALLEQKEYKKMQALHEKQEEEKFMEELREYDNRCTRAAWDYIKTSHDYLSPHPNLAQMDEGICDPKTKVYTSNIRFT